MNVAYIDFKRAFDRVSYVKLVAKLQSCGISGQLLGWIESFLDGRSQQTTVGNSLSAITSLCSGKVQGGVMRSLLFVLYINDIASIFNDNICNYKLFADDFKLYTVADADADVSVLQKCYALASLLYFVLFWCCLNFCQLHYLDCTY